MLARLVQAGKLNWDDPATKYLPQLRMADPWVTQNLLVRDLLVHNIGLREGAGDLMLWPEPNRFTRADIIAGLAYLEAADELSLRTTRTTTSCTSSPAKSRCSGRRRIVRVADAQRGVRAARAVALPGRPVASRRRGERRPAAHAQGRRSNVPIKRTTATCVPAITSAAAGGISLQSRRHAGLGAELAGAGREATGLAVGRAAPRAWTPRTPMPISAAPARLGPYAFLRVRLRLASGRCRWRLDRLAHRYVVRACIPVLTLLPDRRSGFVMLTNGEGDEARTVLTEVMLKQLAAPDACALVAKYAGELMRRIGVEARRSEKRLTRRRGNPRRPRKSQHAAGALARPVVRRIIHLSTRWQACVSRQ